MHAQDLENLEHSNCQGGIGLYIGVGPCNPCVTIIYDWKKISGYYFVTNKYLQVSYKVTKEMSREFQKCMTWENNVGGYILSGPIVN